MASTLVSAPQSVGDVEELVKRLYQPGNPQVISQIQAQLQTLQRSDHGWQMANILLGSTDVNVRFFGALTFIVKLNSDGESLSEDEAIQLRQQLISWLARRFAEGEGALVLKKLCSTLVTCFLRSSVPWVQPIADVAAAVAAATTGTINAGAFHADLIYRLTAEQLVIMFWFSETLADEVSKTESYSSIHHQFHARMESNVHLSSMLMCRGLADTGTEAVRLRTEALKCFLTWVFYAQRVWPHKPEIVDLLRNLIPPAMDCLLIEQLVDEAVNVFSDILENYSSFMGPRYLKALSMVIETKIGPNCLALLKDEDPEAMLTAQLIIAFGIATVQDIVEQPQDLGCKAIKDLQISLLRGPGWPLEDDVVTVLAVEFWNTYVEHAVDALFSAKWDETPWGDDAKKTLLAAIDAFWAKLWFPPVAIINQWTEAQKSEFGTFRADVKEFLQSAFAVLGAAVHSRFAELTVRSLKAREWRAVEAGVYCLNGLADLVVQDRSGDPFLAEVFGSSLFADMSDFTNADISARTRRTVVDMLGCYGSYIERNESFLPSALAFLFGSLETAALANIAAKSIYSLCSSCRHSLTGQLDVFLQQYERFLLGPTAHQYTKEKVIGAIAAIIQALPHEHQKVAPLTALLQHVEKDIQMAEECVASGEVSEKAEYTGVTALQCLASIGKALQIPDELTIYGGEDNNDDDESAAQPSFWHTVEGQQVQQRIMGCFSILQVLGGSGEAIEAACLVLKTGYAETVPGPFVLPPSVTVSFVQQTTLATPHLESVLSAACMLITQHSRLDSPRITNEAAAIYKHVASLVYSQGEPSGDPEIATSCIDLMARLMPHYAEVLLGLQPLELLEKIFQFALGGLTGPDPLPKRSATSFWFAFVKLRDPPRQAAALPGTPVKPTDVMGRFGPLLALALITQIGGNAQRSDLEYLSEPVRALIANQPQSQQWLEAALLDSSFPSDRVDVPEKRRFLQQLVALRGQRKTREAVKEFWIMCRGTVGSFGS